MLTQKSRTPHPPRSNPARLFSKFSPRPCRQVTSYADNLTASVSLTEVQHRFLTLAQTEYQKILAVQSHIIDHAERRVDLFFLILLAYSNQAKTPKYKSTCLQHGRGLAPAEGLNLGTQACHSSLLPSLDDGDGTSLLDGTQALHSLNLTHEFPSFMNRFDGTLEEFCRAKALKIIAQVSQHPLNVFELTTGLKAFFELIQRTLLSKAFRKALVAKGLGEISDKLITLVQAGTFVNKYNPERGYVYLRYVYAFLNLTDPYAYAAIQGQVEAAQKDCLDKTAPPALPSHDRQGVHRRQ
jgi:hypothetical protein